MCVIIHHFYQIIWQYFTSVVGPTYGNKNKFLLEIGWKSFQTDIQHNLKRVNWLFKD